MPGAFDIHHPPSKELLDACIHCGMCLATCPTYVLWGEEMDSPRGRIHLMKMGIEGEPLTPEMAGHFDACLGCMACVTACPSGVRYDHLLEATRQQVERRVPRPMSERAFRRAVFALFPYPRRLRAAALGLRLYQRLRIDGLLRRLGIVRRLPAWLRALESLTPQLRAPVSPPPPRIAPREPKRATVGMLTGCVQRVFFDRVNLATARVLAAEGCEVVIPPDQSCCGALSSHVGREAEAQAFARRTIEAFDAFGVFGGADGLDAVVVNAAGCGSAMKGYGHLLRDDPEYAERAKAFSAKVRDISESLAEMDQAAPLHPLPLTAAYHDACHLAHAQGIRKQPREVLERIPGLTLLEIGEPDVCCGSAGIYNLVEPVPAAELGERKARNVLTTGADVLITSNPGCTLQILAHLRRLGVEMPVLHPAQVLDASVRGTPAADLLRE